MKFDVTDEMRVIGTYPSLGGGEDQPIHNTPITPRENFFRFVRRDHPVWVPGGEDIITILPSFICENRVRGFVADTVPYEAEREAGGRDFFGIEWTYVPSVHGAMVRPGNPVLKDASEWEQRLRPPEFHEELWEEASERLRPYYSTGRANRTTVYTGFFERLISFMDVEGALVALVDDEQKPFVHQMFQMLCDFYDELFDHLKKYLDMDIIYFHDDWGTQRAPFFSPEVCEEMLVPYLKHVSSHAHELGMLIDFHSCGKCEKLVPQMVSAGVDMWSGQNINDWDVLTQEYADKLCFDIRYPMYDEGVFGSIENYLEGALKQWKRYLDTRNVTMSLGPGYNRPIVGRFFDMTYGLGRMALAE